MAFADELVRAAEQAVIAEIGRNDGRRSAHWESRAAATAVLRKLADSGWPTAFTLSDLADEIERER